MSQAGALTNSVTLPSPVAGWNARDPKDSMQPIDAVALVNFYPSTQEVKTRKGYRRHSNALGTKAIEALYSYVKADGTKRLIGCANGNIYNATTLASTASSLGSGFTSNRWQGTNFNNRLILVNGFDAPKSYDGTTLINAGFTTIPNSNDLNSVSSYKDRLYFTAKNSSTIWYGGVSAITGGLTPYDLSAYLTKGGHILTCTQWSQATGDGNENQFVVFGSEGDVLIFNGDYPNNIWILSRRAIIPKPLSIRSIFRLGADIVIATIGGIIKLAEYMKGVVDLSSQRVDDRIDKVFKEYVETYQGNFGWEICYYPSQTMLVVNIPTVEGSATVNPESVQFVWNMQTGAPCLFTGLNASNFTIFNDRLYFSGIDGKVYEFDIGTSDDGKNIKTDLQTSFNYFGNRQNNKRFCALKMNLELTNNANVKYSWDTELLNFDFEDLVLAQLSTTPYDSSYDSEYSDDSEIVNDFVSLAANGKNGSLRIQTDSSLAEVKLISYEVIFDAGGVM
jgi:hypothetical protein